MVKIVLIKCDGSHEELGAYNIPTDYRVGKWVYLTLGGVNDRYSVYRNEPENNTVFVIHDPINPQTITVEAVASV